MRCLLSLMLISAVAFAQDSGRLSTAEIVDLLEKGKIEEALVAAQHGVKLDQDVLDAANKARDRKQVAMALDRRAESLGLLVRCLEKSGKIDEYLNNIEQLADTESQRGKSERAEQLLRKHVQATEAKFGDDVPRVVKSTNGLAFHLYRQNRHADALTLLNHSLKMLEGKFGAEDPRVATTLGDIGVVLRASGKLGEAETALQRCLRIREAKLGAEHLDTGVALLELARIYRAMGQPARALPLFKQSLKIRETKLGAEHVDVASTLSDIADTMQAAGQHQGVVPMLERALKIREAKLPASHQDIATSLNNLAVAHWNSGDYVRYEKTLLFLERSLKVSEANLGPDHPEVAVTLVNIASVLDITWRQLRANQLYSDEVKNMIQKRQGERLALFQRALKILETQRGPSHPEVAVCLDRMGNMLMADGKLAEAEPLFRRCVKIRETQLPPAHPDLIDGLETVVQINVMHEAWKEAADGLDDISRRMRLHVRNNLPSLSTPQQLAFLQRTHELVFHRCLTLPFHRRDDKALIARSAEWVLNGKAVAQEARAEQAALILESKDPRAPEIARKLAAVRAEIDQLKRFIVGDSPQEGARKKRLAELADQESVLVSSLNLRAAPDRGDVWVTLEAVRARIPANAVLVEIVDFDLWDFKKNDWKSIPFDQEKQKKMTDAELAQSRYVAWIIPPAGKGDVRHVDLGDSWKIREAVEAYQKAMKQALNKIQVDEGDAEKEIGKHLKAIADRCLKPLEEHLAGSSHWILGLDNHLWLVPWAALPLKDGTSVVEKYTISHVTTGRDLLAPARKSKPGPTLLVGDPDFDLSSAAVVKEAATFIPKDRLLVRGPKTEETDRVPRDWQRLPGTADEIKQITTSLTKYAKSEPQIFSGRKAVESLVKSARGPRLLVLSTHGFTLPPPPQPLPMARNDYIIPARKVQMRIDGLAPIESIGDPMARCGLVFAGANKRAKDTDPAADDGILTGTEVLGCDLRGTELVVLSACETGLGDIKLGEGVAGLRQAFQSAGARSVLASLWKVSDKESAKLMTLFWDNLAKGQTRADALRNAQLSIIRERRRTENAAHPFFWAAFTLTGDWR